MSLGYGILRAFILILSSLTVLKYCQMGPSEIGWALPRRFPWVVSLGILVGMADHILGNFIGLTLPSMAFFLRLPYGMTWSLDPVWNQLANPSAFHNLLFQWSLVVLSEELAYRGVIQSVLRKKMEAWPSIILASLAFSCCHFAPFWDPHRPGFSELTICRFLALFVAGLIHGWLREWTGSLWAPIASHGASNFIGFEMDVRFRMI
jgi:membrane protease YdiL (CAAX protease family)